MNNQPTDQADKTPGVEQLAIQRMTEGVEQLPELKERAEELCEACVKSASDTSMSAAERTTLLASYIDAMFRYQDVRGATLVNTCVMLSYKLDRSAATIVELEKLCASLEQRLGAMESEAARIAELKDRYG